MKLQQGLEVAARLAGYGINVPAVHGSIVHRKTAQAVCVRKLVAQGYEEIKWDQEQWEAYYEASRAINNHNYVCAGMGANIMKKGNEIIIVGRSTFQWTMVVIAC